MIEIRHKETGVVLHRVAADSLESACLSRLRLRGADLRDANLSNADLRAADLRQADLRGANLTGALLQHRTYSLFLRSGLSAGGTFGCFWPAVAILVAGVIGLVAGLPDWVLGIALFCAFSALISLPAWGTQRTCLDEADLSGATLCGANLANATCHRADLREANLTGAVLTQTNCNRADLRGADLTGTELRITSFQGADLRGAAFGGADLSGVWYDSSTRWSEGFDLPAHGAKPLGKLFDYRQPPARRSAEEMVPAAKREGLGDEPSPSVPSEAPYSGEG